MMTSHFVVDGLWMNFFGIFFFVRTIAIILIEYVSFE